jgi:hypothetical protein
MWVTSTPITALRSEQARWVGEPVPGRAVLHPGLVRLGIGDERTQIAGRQILARHQQLRGLGDERDRREVGRRVVQRPLVERLIVGMRADAAERERIAVGGGARHPGGPGHAAGAANVLDQHLLAQELGETLRQDTPHDVGAAAGRERNHHGHRPQRPILRCSRHGRAQKRCGRDQGGNTTEDGALRDHAGTVRRCRPNRQAVRVLLQEFEPGQFAGQGVELCYHCVPGARGAVEKKAGGAGT